jgi:O-methyltransferase
MVERALTHSLYGVLDLRMGGGTDVKKRGVGFRNRAKLALLQLLRSRGIEPVRMLPGDGDELREVGADWPLFAQTMIGRRRLANLRMCTETAVAEGVPGDLIEAGVWRGGAGIMMRAVLEAYGVQDRSVWLADSFAGLPSPEAGEYPADAGAGFHDYSRLAVPIEEVRDNFRRYGLLDDRVRLLEGWFRDTLPSVADRRWAVIRLDGDMYGSTMDSLENLYPGLSPGGYLIADDYGWIENMRRAVDDYREERDIRDPIQRIDQNGVYWRRETG